MYGERMRRLSRQAVIVAVVLLAATGLAVSAFVRDAGRSEVDASLRFDDVPFSASELGGILPADELATIERIAHGEVRRAFAGLPIRFSTTRQGRYHVLVVQDVRDPRFRRDVRLAGQSRGMTGIGGQGTVSFSFMASGAIVYSPGGADRAAIIDAIGRGIGRSAVHEFAHQLLPHAPLHATRDRASYEFYSAARPEQFIGDMRWDLAWPLLQSRLAR